MPSPAERAPFRLGIPTPYLRVNDAGRAIEFYRVVFGAQEVVRLTEPGGRVAHAELRMGDGGSPIMLSDESAPAADGWLQGRALGETERASLARRLNDMPRLWTFN